MRMISLHRNIVTFSFVVFFLSFYFFSSEEKCFGWGSGHDVLSTLLQEYLPAEIQQTLSPSDRKGLVQWSHYPDLPMKTREDMELILGVQDVAFLFDNGMKNSMWFHSDTGQVCSFVLLTKAFREKNGTRAAFYMSELSHSVGDEGALNHTPMNNMLQCMVSKNLAPVPFDHLKDVKMNPSDLHLGQKVILDRIRAELKNYKPKILTRDFHEFVYLALLSECESGVLSTRLEEQITYGKDKTQWEDGFTQLGVYQIKLLLDLCYTMWIISRSDSEIAIPENWQKVYTTRLEKRIAQCNAEEDSVFRELYVTKSSSPNKGNVGLLLEPYSLFGPGGTKLSFVGRVITAAAGRTLRDAGYGIVPLNLPTVIEKGLPSPKEVPVLLLCSGRYQKTGSLSEHLHKYRKEGGKLVWIGGTDRDHLTDPIGKSLRPRKNEELPVSTKWSLQNEDVLDKMEISFAGPFEKQLGNKKYHYRINPNINGFAKAACAVSIDLTDSKVEPLVWLNNGNEKFCIAAGTKDKEIVWLPEYLLFPYTIAPDTTIGYFPAARLDSFGGPIVVEAVGYLLSK